MPEKDLPPMPPDEELVAYLDGELDAEQSRRIEALLASDAEVRRRVQALERTWDMLDELDAMPADARFTHSTLEMVAFSARRELDQELAQTISRRRLRWLIRLGVVLLAALLGFSIVAFLAPDPNRQLLENLPILERFEEYLPAGSVEFLQLLDKSQLCATEEGEPSGEDLKRTPAETLVERRARIENMTLEKKQKLLQASERFAALTSAEQQALRELHAYLQHEPRSERLCALMRRYVEWWKNLPSYSRMEVLELPPKERIEWIKARLREEQKREGGRHLGAKDIEALQTWLKEYLDKQESSYLETLSKQERQQYVKLSPPMQRGAVFWHTWQRWQTPGPHKSPLSDKELAEIRSRLSQATRQRLEALPPERQWQLLVRWLLFSMRRPGSFAGPSERPSPPDDERLVEFFEKELSDEQRERLLSLPGDEMHRELQRLFLSSRGRQTEGPPRKMFPRENSERPLRHPPGSMAPPWPGSHREPAKKPPSEPLMPARY